MNHRYLDDVGFRALNRGIDGIAFGKTSHGVVARIDVGKIAFPAE